MTSDDVHIMLGAYVLGGLSDDDHHTFTEHLRTCTRCQEGLGQLSGLPRLLALVEPPAPTGDGSYAAGLAERDTPLPWAADEEPAQASPSSGLDDLLAAARKRRSVRRRWTTAVSGIAATGLLATGVWLGPRLTAEDARPTRHVVAVAPSGSSAAVDIDLVTRGWGTQIDLDCKDMPVGEELVLYVVDSSGKATQVASWLGTPSKYSSITGATALRTAEIRALEVRTTGGAVVATART